MYTLLYSFPFSKRDYLLAKFLSAFLVVIGIVILLALAFLLGSMMPGVKEAAMLPFDIWNYAQLLGVFLLPNMLFFGAVVMALTLFTRNIYIPFIGVIFMIIIQSFGKGVLAANGYDMLAALSDPTGEASVKYIVRYWTLEERNFNALPLKGAILYNRLFWLAITTAILTWTYRRFEFNQFVSSSAGKKVENDSENFIVQRTPSITIPQVETDFSLTQQMKTAWHLSSIDFRSIVMSWPFVSILFAGSLLVLFQQYQMNPQEGIATIPTTANMLRFPMFFFSAIVNLLTFLYAGVLMYRGSMVRMDGFIDTSPQPNWVLVMSKVLGLFKMQFILLSMVMIAGLVAQVVSGYYRFELWHYFFELYILQGVHFMAWACLAICIHSVAKNMYLGYFILILVPVYNLLLPFLADYLEFGFLKNSLFQFNSVSGIFLGFDYSEFTGYGSQLTTYFSYKFYWVACSIGLLLIALLFWKRGLTFSIKERLDLVKKRSSGALGYSTILGFVFFVATGITIYYQENVVSKVHFSDKKVKVISAENEKRFGHLEHLIQPQLTDVKMTMDIYPQSNDYKINGTFTYVNKLDQSIDTILISQSLKEKTNCKVLEAHQVLEIDDLLHYDLVLLDKKLEQGDSIHIHVEIENYPNSLLHHNSRVANNGTYITSNVLPSLGIRDAFLTKKKDRKKFGLGDRETRELSPLDSTLLGYEYSGNQLGLITYDCILSTSLDQSAFTMGQVKRHWQEGDRKYYHYRSDGPIVNTMSWMSGEYQYISEQGKYQYLEMYRHPVQDYNDPHFFHGLNASLNYCSDWFGPLDYDTLRVIEFPETEGTYATVNGNLIPYSEVYFKCDVHNHDNEMFNIPFFVSAHEIAHCWWGHRVDPANIPGGRMISEGMADYLAMMAVEKEFDKEKLYTIRKRYHELYLQDRADQANETALIYSSLDNEYLNYRKASLALYAMNKYLSDEVLNGALAKFEKRYKYTEPPYPTSLDFVAYIKEATPDSLQYLVHDYFETITLYDNELTEVTISDKDGLYRLNAKLSISKYHADAKGKRSYGETPLKEGGKNSLQLADYIELGFYNEEDELIGLELVLFTEIENVLDFTFDEKVTRVEIDPRLLLIDVERGDDVWVE